MAIATNSTSHWSRTDHTTGTGTCFVPARLLQFSAVGALPQSTVEPLQRVQNAAARMIFNISSTEHVTPCLIQLHWLPVQFRITVKLCVMMHNIHAGKTPHYLSDIVQLTSTRVTRPELRSSSNTASCVTPHLRTKFEERAFSFAGPASWNSLPAELRSVSDSTVFKHKLNTHLFNIAFNV